MAAAGLPHTYPFRFVDIVSEAAPADFSGGRVRVRVSANARAAMGEAWQSPLLLAEAVAQSALLLEGGDAESARRGFLAGLEAFEFARSPRAGETLEVRVRLAARFGAVARFEGEVLAEGDAIAKGAVLVRKDRAPASPAEEARP
jgi:3-hydroxymyristoyl/3-hydroxydecanoyl-(acyl carrier protein) dehydratase